MPAIATPVSSSEPPSDLEQAAWRGMLQAHAEVTHALDAQMQRSLNLSRSGCARPVNWNGTS